MLWQAGMFRCGIWTETVLGRFWEWLVVSSKQLVPWNLKEHFLTGIRFHFGILSSFAFEDRREWDNAMKLEGTFPDRYWVSLWNFKQLFVWRSERARRFVSTERWRKIRGEVLSKWQLARVMILCLVETVISFLRTLFHEYCVHGNCYIVHCLPQKVWSRCALRAMLTLMQFMSGLLCSVDL